MSERNVMHTTAGEIHNANFLCGQEMVQLRLLNISWPLSLVLLAAQSELAEFAGSEDEDI